MQRPGLALFVVFVVTLALSLARTVSITNAHNEYWDDQYHLARGVAWLHGVRLNVPHNDPPIGEALLAIPVANLNSVPPSPNRQPTVETNNILYQPGQPLTADQILRRVAAWKSLLFSVWVTGMAAFAASCCPARPRWAGAATALWLLADPTIAAHVVPAATDIFAMMGATTAIVAATLYVRRPTWGRWAGLLLAVSLAPLLKHTAVAGSIAAMLIVLLCDRRAVSVRWRPLVLLVVCVPVMMWAWMGFDVARPSEYCQPSASIGMEWVNRPIVGGAYIGSLLEASRHTNAGHATFLLGSNSMTGWWYYYPVVAALKIPPTLLVAFLSCLVMALARARWPIEPLTLGAAVAIGMLLASPINMGARHGLLAYGCVVLLLPGLLHSGRKWVMGGVMGALLLGLVHGLSVHPNEISFVAWPIRKPHRLISDSNIDWGQGLRQVDLFFAEQKGDGRTVHVRPFGDPRSVTVPVRLSRLGDRLRVLSRASVPPTSGWLVISAVRESGMYEPQSPYLALWEIEPDAVIGNGATLIYDMDRLTATGFKWPAGAPTTLPAPAGRR